jgi:hypothetical protein
MTPNTKMISPPWSLTGSGYILIYRFNKEFIKAHGFLADFQKEKFKGGLGVVMLVDYQTSPIGSYHELLFIPGLFSFRNKKVFSISKIYVSTQGSVVNGVENWGIPKEQADFSWMKRTNGDSVSVTVGDTPVLQVDFTKKWFRFPLSTSLLPLAILQQRRDEMAITQPSSKGIAHFAKAHNMKINSSFFPDLSRLRPIITLKIENFEMEFPKAKVYKISK